MSVLFSLRFGDYTDHPHIPGFLSSGTLLLTKIHCSKSILTIGLGYQQYKNVKPDASLFKYLISLGF